MYLVQLLLPLSDNQGNAFSPDQYERVRQKLTERFGGLTAYTRSPATGLWKESPQVMVRDQIVIYEVMTNTLDSDWWQTYRKQLNDEFKQEELVIRASAITLL